MADCVERLRDKGLLIQPQEREDIAQEILRLRVIIDNVRLAIDANGHSPQTKKPALGMSISD